MKDRKAYSLKTPIMIYNMFQVISNIYLFYKVRLGNYLFWKSWKLFLQALEMWRTYNWICQPTDYSNSPFAVAVSRLNYSRNIKNF